MFRPAGLLAAGALLAALPFVRAVEAGGAPAPVAQPTAVPRMHIETSGYATVLHAPPSSRPVARMKRYEPEETRLMRELGISMDDARRRVNPDEGMSEAAYALHLRLQASVPDHYVGSRIVRDPYARFAFQFRRDAAATLARFTSDDRFIAIEGGIPRVELDPAFQFWTARFIEHRILDFGSLSEFEGRMEFDISIEQSRFDALATKEGWVIPGNVDLHFPPPLDADAVDPALARFVRIFPRNERGSGPVTLEYSSARLILRDGCFRLQGAGGVEPLVLFGRGDQLGLDSEGFMIVFDPLAVEHDRGPARVGEIVVTGGFGSYDEMDAGTKALRAACGSAPIAALDSPVGEHEFEQRYPPE